MSKGKDRKRYFIITVDTEGDDLWTYKCTRYGLKDITVANAEGLERFQMLCEEYGFIPTWLVNYEMSQAEIFRSLARTALAKKRAEIGMHMHAWNSPPILHLPYNPKGDHPYIGEYSKKLQWEKMKYLTRTLEDTFQCSITAFRSGRWYLDEFVLKCLIKLGFTADCSVTPGISWSGSIGNHMYGTDYSKDRYRGAYQLHKKDIHRSGRSGIYEVPPTILRKVQYAPPIGIKISKEWLRPNGSNLSEMLWITEEISKNRKMDYLEFMIHSSELYPGGSPTFKTEKSIEKLYEDMEILFKKIYQKYSGVGLSDYVQRTKQARGGI